MNANQDIVHILDFGKVIKRLKAYINLKTDFEVANLFHMSKTALSERKRRNSFPKDKISAVCSKNSINPNWMATGKGWAFHPSNSGDALDWMQQHLTNDIEKIVIVTYPHANDHVMSNGFLLKTSQGIISMSGTSTTSGYMGTGPRHYYQILKIIQLLKITQRGNILVGRVSGDSTEDSLDAMDLSSFIKEATFSPGALEKEIGKLGFDSLYSVDLNAVEEKEAVHDKNLQQALLLGKAQKILTEGSIQQRALLRGIIEEIYSELHRKMQELHPDEDMEAFF